VTGKEDTKEPITLETPRAIISWLASTLAPLAVLRYSFKYTIFCFNFMKEDLPKDLAMLTDSKIMTNGTRKRSEPKLLHISPKLRVSFPF